MDGAEEEVVEKSNKSDSEEDDCENFFLQPASSPYNIAEKVAEANNILFNEHFGSTRDLKVKFAEALVDFEPDLTDDDVQSIESYNEIPDYTVAEDPVEELKYVIQSPDCCTMYDILEEAEETEEIEEIPEEVFVEEEVHDGSSSSEEALQEPVCEKLVSGRKRASPTGRKCIANYDIICKNHCIEELESRLDLCISKLHIHEKPPCPALKLQRRKCCERSKCEQRLPLYTGSRSEYGLSDEQLEMQEKRKEQTKLREDRRHQLQEAYRQRKIQQNEEIFSQWLKDISGRKQDGEKKSPKVKIRPKTASSAVCNLHVKKKRRPMTTGASVFIQIPKRVLDEGIRIGDLLVTKKNLSSKQIHIFGFS